MELREVKSLTFLLFLVGFIGQEAVSGCHPTDCTELDVSSPCRSLLGRGSVYASPQQLPDNVMLNEEHLQVGIVTLSILAEQKPTLPPACVEFTSHLLCLGVNPPCDQTTNTSMLLCPETCHVHSKLIASHICDEYFENVREVLLNSQYPQYQGIVVYFDGFNCTDPTTYFQDEECANRLCTNLFSPDVQAELLIKPSLYECQQTGSTVCQALFPNTFEYTIYLPGRVESDIFDIISMISSFLDGPTCSKSLFKVGCQYLHPACTREGTQTPICKEQCSDTLTVLADQCNLRQAVESVNFTVLDHFVDTLLQFNCSDPSTYLVPDIPIDNSTCFNLLDLLPDDSEDKNYFAIGVLVAMVIAGLAVLFLVAAIIFVCVGVYTRHKWKSMSREWLRHFSRSRDSQRQRMPEMRAIIRPVSDPERQETSNEVNEPAQSAVDVVTLSPIEQQKYERLFVDSLVPYSKLQMDECIGQGAFGKVYSGFLESRGGQTKIAIKTIKNIGSEEQLSAFLAESLIMKDFQHPHILGLVGVCFDAPDGSPYIVLPFMANGSVKTYLRQKRVHVANFEEFPEGLKLADLTQMCMDVAEGMKYLAEHKFVHRDLAARNCMVSEEGCVLIGDFGLARDVYSADYYRAIVKTRLPIKWMSPEAINDGISHEKTDVWSYGVTCWEVFSLGRTPYPGIENHEILEHISGGGRLKKPALCPDELYVLFSKCFGRLPEERPSFQELVSLLKEYWDEQHLYIVQSFLPPQNNQSQTQQ